MDASQEDSPVTRPWLALEVVADINLFQWCVNLGRESELCLSVMAAPTHYL